MGWGGACLQIGAQQPGKQSALWPLLQPFSDGKSWELRIVGPEPVWERSHSVRQMRWEDFSDGIAGLTASRAPAAPSDTLGVLLPCSGLRVHLQQQGQLPGLRRTKCWL